MVKYHCDNPNNLIALKAVAKATSSGVLFIKAAKISAIAGRQQGSFLWKVQYLCKKALDLSVKQLLIFSGSFEALILGNMKGESEWTNNLFRGIASCWRILLTPESDLSLHKYPKK